MATRPYSALIDSTRGSRLAFALVIVSVVLATLATLTDPLILRFTLDNVLSGKAPVLPPFLERILDGIGGVSVVAKNLWICALLVVIAASANAVFSFSRGYLASVSAESTTKRLRDRLAAHLDALPLGYFARIGAGDLVQRATSDVETIRRFLATQIVEIGRASSLLILTVVVMAGIDGYMTLVSLPVVPAVFAFSYLFMKRIEKAFRVSDEAEAALTQVVEENLRGIRVVRAFDRGEHEKARFDAKNGRYTEETRKLIVLFGWYWGVSVLLCAVQEAATIAVGAGRVASGQLSAGSFLAFVAYVGRLLWPVRQMGRTLAEAAKAKVSLGRISEILDTETEAAIDARLNSGATTSPPRSKGGARLVVEGLTVEHEAGKPVLIDVSFSLEPGETLAILGRTGSGKSTLAAALARLVEPARGRILIDGVDIRELDRRLLRERVGLALQEPWLFSRSMRENLELGTGELPDTELGRAARLSALGPVVTSFPEGWATSIGEGGVTLSGGQRQRLALARVLARRPDLLVLDDSLSALDTETDALVRAALDAEREGGAATTTIVIAHRVTTLLGADRVLVLEEGRVADIGSHEELMSRPGLYRRVRELQAAHPLNPAAERGGAAKVRKAASTGRSADAGLAG
ncbi:MAG TPA: ABC transporter ATP-binding protein [Rectinemataceae bacterium]|nr:ABC transporter ATP-binding protein [Rectinemataceae bacterium]